MPKKGHRRGIATRFWEKVEKGPEAHCWRWTASLTRNGYGAISDDNDKMQVATRISYSLHYGPIPAGLVVRHRCDNPPCVNPHHLEIGTPADNVADAIARRVFRRRTRDNGHVRSKHTTEQVAAAVAEYEALLKPGSRYRGRHRVAALCEKHKVSIYTLSAWAKVARNAQ